MGFNKIVFSAHINYSANIHIRVHPFAVSRMVMMTEPGEYNHYFTDDTPLTESQKILADTLWEAIPGLNNLFFDNGEITIQHDGLFDDSEILEAAKTIIMPELEATLELQRLRNG